MRCHTVTLRALESLASHRWLTRTVIKCFSYQDGFTNVRNNKKNNKLYSLYLNCRWPWLLNFTIHRRLRHTDSPPPPPLPFTPSFFFQSTTHPLAWWWDTRYLVLCYFCGLPQRSVYLFHNVYCEATQPRSYKFMCDCLLLLLLLLRVRNPGVILCILFLPPC
jgi:hypothetical protein